MSEAATPAAGQIKGGSALFDQRMKRYDRERFKLMFIDGALGAMFFRRDFDKGDKYCFAIGFSGRKTKADFYLKFDDTAAAERYRRTWYERLKQAAIEKCQRKQATRNMRQARALKLGQVLVSIWGYEQTNVNYWQVTGRPGAQSVEIREIAQGKEMTGDMTGNCWPLQNEFTGEPVRFKVRDDGVSVRINSYSIATQEDLDNSGMAYRKRWFSQYA